MEIKFNIEKSQRKWLAQAIAASTGGEVKYLGVPSCAFQIGAFHLSKDAVLTFDDSVDDETLDKLLDDLDDAGYDWDEPTDELTVTMPRDLFTDQALTNLRQVIANKKTLLMHALETDSLEINEDEETVGFPWFTLHDPSDGDAYIKFISMLCAFVKERKRVNDKPDTSDNEKYAFRCFLLRIGMIGAEYKAARKVRRRNLTGSSAFRHGKPEGGEDDAVSE